MNFTINIPTDIELNESQQKEIVVSYIKEYFLGLGFGSELPFYCAELDAFLIQRFVKFNPRVFKIADGDNKKIGVMLDMLNELESSSTGVLKYGDAGDVTDQFNQIQVQNS